MALPLTGVRTDGSRSSLQRSPRARGGSTSWKWTGFRCLAFRDGDKVLLQLKSGQPR